MPFWLFVELRWFRSFGQELQALSGIAVAIMLPILCRPRGEVCVIRRLIERGSDEVGLVSGLPIERQAWLTES